MSRVPFGLLLALVACSPARPGLNGDGTKPGVSDSDGGGGGGGRDAGTTTDECTRDADCADDEECALGICVEKPDEPAPGSVGSTCARNTDCGTGGVCATDIPGGYCTKLCSAGCPAGSHCAEGQCVKTCTSEAGCRSDLDCLDVDGDNRRECFVGGGSNVLRINVGVACTSNTPCGADGECFPASEGWTGGYCTGACSSSEQCGTAGACMDFGDGAGFCLKSCASASCRSTGYECGTYDTIEGDSAAVCVPAATGSGGVGDSCAAVGDCGGGAAGDCITSWPDGYCTVLNCENTACPSGSVCVQFTDLAACMDACDDGTTCRAGYECASLDTRSACLPPE